MAEQLATELVKSDCKIPLLALGWFPLSRTGVWEGGDAGHVHSALRIQAHISLDRYYR